MADKILYDRADFADLSLRWQRAVMEHVTGYLMDALMEMDDTDEISLDEAWIDEFLEDHVFTITEYAPFAYSINHEGRY